jgi:hypothetical protein
MDHGDFDSVSWRSEGDGSRTVVASSSGDEDGRQRRDTNGKRRARAVTPPPQAGYNADALDLAGVGDGRLECTVDSPLKENDGSKDAFVSYLVTTHVSSRRATLLIIYQNAYLLPDRLPHLPKTDSNSPQAIYRLRLLVQGPHRRLPSMRCATASR